MAASAAASGSPGDRVRPDGFGRERVYPSKRRRKGGYVLTVPSGKWRPPLKQAANPSGRGTTKAFVNETVTEGLRLPEAVLVRGHSQPLPGEEIDENVSESVLVGDGGLVAALEPFESGAARATTAHYDKQTTSSTGCFEARMGKNGHFLDSSERGCH